jgi:outer membrane protein assembly factor BamB
MCNGFCTRGVVIGMYPQKIGGDLLAISRITVVVLLIVVMVAAVAGSVFVFEYSTHTPETTNTAAVPDLGNETWQFEGNNLHVYDYAWNGTIATFNTTVIGAVIVPPTFSEGLLLVDVSNVTVMTGGVVAINMTNGQTVWTAVVPNLMMTQPLTYEGLVIIGLGNNVFQNSSMTTRGTGTNCVAALNSSTGQAVWTFPTLGEDMPTPVIYNGLVVFPNGNGVVYALNASTGEEAWSSSMPPAAYSSMSSPALLGGSIYFGESNPYTFDSVNLTDGQVSWSTSLPATGGLDDSSPVVWNGIVISGYTVTTGDGLFEPVLFGANATDGQILWQVDENAGPAPSGEEFTPTAVWNGIVYSDSPENGTLFAVNATSGAQLWTFSTGKATSSINVFDGHLWIVNSTGTSFVLNPTTGALLKSTYVGVPVLDGNLVFVGQSVIIWGGNGQVISMPVSDIYPSG